MPWLGWARQPLESESALNALPALYPLAPSAVLGIALLIALRYSLTAQRHAGLRAALEKRRG